MIIACLILNILTLLGLGLAGCIYFNENYIIVRIEEWNKIANVFNDACAAGLVDNNDEFIPLNELPVQEAAGGLGFFKEQLDEQEEDDLDE